MGALRGAHSWSPLKGCLFQQRDRQAYQRGAAEGTLPRGTGRVGTSRSDNTVERSVRPQGIASKQFSALLRIAPRNDKYDRRFLHPVNLLISQNHGSDIGMGLATFYLAGCFIIVSSCGEKGGAMYPCMLIKARFQGCVSI